MDKVITRPSTDEYREGWELVFGKKRPDIWKCLKCGKEVDYGESQPSRRTHCSETGGIVKMIKVTK